jgi:hypothetical protein
MKHDILLLCVSASNQARRAFLARQRSLRLVRSLLAAHSATQISVLASAAHAVRLTVTATNAATALTVRLRAGCERLSQMQAAAVCVQRFVRGFAARQRYRRARAAIECAQAAARVVVEHQRMAELVCARRERHTAG